MVKVSNPKNVSYWYKEGSMVAISKEIPHGKLYVKVESEGLKDGDYRTNIYKDGKKLITLIDDGSCKSGYSYTLNIQKNIYKFLRVKFPEKAYADMFRSQYKQNKKGGLCK